MKKQTACFLSFLVFGLFLICMFGVSGAEFYEYVDEKGVKTFTDRPQEIPADDSNTKVHKEIYEDLNEDQKKALRDKQQLESEAREKKKRQQLLKTPVQISNNQIIVPVTFRESYHEVTVNMLLDTGANITMVDTYVAQKLKIKQGQLGSAIVAGGSRIKTLVVNVDQIEVGPKRINFQKVMVSQHAMSNRFHGLLGQDFLSRFRYTIDYDNRIIQWAE